MENHRQVISLKTPSWKTITNSLGEFHPNRDNVLFSFSVLSIVFRGLSLYLIVIHLCFCCICLLLIRDREKQRIGPLIFAVVVFLRLHVFEDGFD